MTTLARLAAVAAALTRAAADALDGFARSLAAQQERVPSTVPLWMDEEADLP